MNTPGKQAVDYTDVIVVLEEGMEASNQALLEEGGRIARLLGGSLYAIGGGVAPQTVNAALQNTPFRVMLFAHTDQGRELAPLVARSFDAPAVTDCFDIRFREAVLYYARYVCGGQFEQEVRFEHPPEFVSVSLNSLETLRGAAESFQVKMIHPPESKSARTSKTIRTLPPDFRTVDIRYAKRVIDIGAGCDQPALMGPAEKLACLLEASIGTTRLVADNGRIPKTRMIGQTGKTVAPEFSLTLGVSGSPHHMAGIQRSGRILSVNSDERAPVFRVCDEGFVADLKGLLPKLIRRIEQYRDRDLP